MRQIGSTEITLKVIIPVLEPYLGLAKIAKSELFISPSAGVGPMSVIVRDVSATPTDETLLFLSSPSETGEHRCNETLRSLNRVG